MSEPTTQTTDRIKEAVALRVQGESWAKIATRYGYKNENSAMHMLTQEYPDLWRTEYELARAKYLDEIEAEALLTQRQLMRPFHADGKTPRSEQIRQSAAHSLLNHCRQLRAQKIEMTGSGGGPMAVQFVFQDEENHNGDAE